MDCLRCGTAMDWEAYEGVAIDRCPECRGVWLDREELADILGAREVEFGPERREALRVAEERHLRAPEAVADEEPLPCPKCRRTMEKNRYPYALSVVIDRCERGCGLWLDAGELDFVQIAVEGTEDEVEAYMNDHAQERGDRWDRERREQLAAARSGREQYWKTQREFLLGLIRRLLGRS